MVCPEVHSVRLFPKNHGAAKYELTGIARRCDWIVLTDTQPPHTHLIRNCQAFPKTIFLSMRAPFHALRFFCEQVLPAIETRFVLVSGSEDVSLPRQMDRRWRQYNSEEIGLIRSLLEDSRVAAWFAENLDTRHPKLFPLPTGMVPPPQPGSSFDFMPADRASNGAQVLCAHRVRNGPQWDVRRQVTALCRQLGEDLFRVIEPSVTVDEFVQLLRTHSFVLCVEGGGLDPSPKAWMALMNGCIPIIRAMPTTDAYRQMPVVYVADWQELSSDPEWYETRRAELEQHFFDPEKKKVLAHCLSLDFWWKKILSSADRPVEMSAKQQAST